MGPGYSRSLCDWSVFERMVDPAQRQPIGRPERMGCGDCRAVGCAIGADRQGSLNSSSDCGQHTAGGKQVGRV